MQHEQFYIVCPVNGGICSARAQPLPRAFRLRLRALDEAKVARICGEAVEAPAGAAGATAPGDGRKMRGIPIVGRSTSGGAIPGSDPLRALLAKERRGGS